MELTSYNFSQVNHNALHYCFLSPYIFQIDDMYDAMFEKEKTK